MNDPAINAEAQRRAEIIDGLHQHGTAHGTYRPGDHLHEQNLWDERSGRDELEAIVPRAKPPHPIQDDPAIACPHGDDDRDCWRCMEAAFGSAAHVIAATKARKKAA